MSSFYNDIKYALRQLRKRPGFAVAAILTLALGLTVNAVVFSSVSDFFLRPLPVPDSEDLVVIAQKTQQFQFAFPLSYLDFLDFRAAVENPDTDNTGLARTFSGLMAYNEQAVHLSRTNEVTERTWVHLVSNNYFSVLDVHPLHGRFFLPTEGQHEGKDPIIVLTHHVWQRRFNADPGIVGQSVKLNGVPFTVVGVTQPNFHGAAFGTAYSGFVPVTMLGTIMPGNHMLTGRGDVGFFLMGRMRPGVAFPQARKAVELFMSQLVNEYPDYHAKNGKAVVMREHLSRPTPYVASLVPFIVSALMGLALLVLIVAIANVANLLFARAADQEREIAIRGALGASRWRLFRQLLVESVLLALGAGGVGMALVFWLSPYLYSIVPSPTAPAADLGTDWRLFVFTFIASLLTGMFTGLLPALKATKLNLVPVLKEGTRTLAGTRHPWRSLLVTGQVAVSVVVLICAGLAVRSLHRLSNVPLGFRSSNLLLASFDLELQRYTQEQGQNFNTQLLEKARTLPGVTHATLAAPAPFDVGGGMRGDISPEGQEQAYDERFELIPCIHVDETFLQTADIRVLEGREFRPQDNKAGPRVAIVNRVLAGHFWPNQQAVGRTLRIGGRAHEVIGIIGECCYWSITDRNRPLVFRPLAQNYRGHLTLMVHTTGPCAPLRGAIQQIVRQLDPDLPVYRVQTMKQHIADSPLGLMPMRMGATLAGVQGVLALLLAALGITGLVSFAVTQRTREIGIRMALGANTKDVLKLITKQGLRLTCIGLAIGLVLALGVSHLLAGLLYSVNPTDPVVFFGVMALIMITALFAGWLPARRAAKTDPMEALRYE